MHASNLREDLDKYQKRMKEVYTKKGRVRLEQELRTDELKEIKRIRAKMDNIAIEK